MRRFCKSCKIIEKNNQIMKEQALRIVELKQEVNDLAIELEKYRRKEMEITQLLAYSKKKSEEIVQEAKIKYALECQRLRLYRNKWMRYIKDKNKAGKLAEDIERTNRVLKECQIQLEDMLYTDLGININVADSYICERERIDDEPSLNYQAIIDEHTKSPIKTGSVENIEDEQKIRNEELEKMLDKLRI